LTENEPKKMIQWINPVFFNNDFPEELNFPLWFDDSIVKSHGIYKITKRIYRRILGDTAEINDQKQAIPKEKIEYYFDPNGLVDQIVIYTYYDDREISRANIVYEGNMLSSGYRKARILPMINLTKKQGKDEFSTEIIYDKIPQFSFYSSLFWKKKYAGFTNFEKDRNIIYVKKKKYWGPLSIDSIIHPKETDLLVLGTMRRPYKRYQVENIVKESNVHSYQYWSSGMLRKRIKSDYPFEFRRTYIYGKKNKWIAYVDSTFSEGNYIVKIENNIIYDQFERPIEINHLKKNEDGQGFFYRETLHYRTKK
jgi:hypothetical protein